MKCRAVIFGLLLLVTALSFGGLALFAQDEPQAGPYGPPKPAGYSIPSMGDEQPVGELQPDYSPLTGIQNATLGILEIRHSYWVPGLQFSSNERSSGSSNWAADNYLIGNLSLLEVWSRATLAINYSGGGFLTSNSQQGNGFYQQLALAQNFQSTGKKLVATPGGAQIDTARWLIQILDLFAYIPQSSFGYGGGTNLGIPGVGGSLGTTTPGLSGSYVPNQSIYGVGASYNNTAALQATYTLSRRSSVTLSGSYGILSFAESGYYDSYNTVGSVGYNYALSRNNTIGLIYRFSAYQFPSNPQAYGANVMSVAYGRKVTGHLALRLFAGPEIINYRIPVGSNSRTTGFSASANLTYGFRKGTFDVNYIHGLSGGSGVLIGSDLDQLTATVSYSLTRVWSGNVNFGYSRNSQVGGTGSTAYSTYDNWFVGGGVKRPVGRELNFAVGYTANIGSFAGPGCIGSACNASSTYQTITVNFQWHPRPLVLP